MTTSIARVRLLMIPTGNEISRQTPAVIALRAARIFDGTRVIESSTILLDGTKVIGFDERLPDHIEVIDFGDATILSGLIDCHQHLCFNGQGTLEEQVADISDDQLAERATNAAQRALRSGTTTVRDLGDRRWITLGLDSSPKLPSILRSGPPITRTGGHCWYLGGECEPDMALLRRAVAERAERGCDVVKVMATGGALTPTYPMWEPQFGLEELRVIVDEAHRAGLPVASHCHASISIGWSLDAGVDSIEHCTFVTASGRSEPDELLIERLARSNVALSVTAGRLPDVIAPPIVEQNLPTLRALWNRLHELGALVVVGTDAGIGPGKPHDVLRFAARDLVDAGMQPTDALVAITSRAAKACGVEDRKGRLAVGYDADVVVVGGDPCVDIGALQSVLAVWNRGERVALTE